MKIKQFLSAATLGLCLVVSANAQKCQCWTCAGHQIKDREKFWQQYDNGQGSNEGNLGGETQLGPVGISSQVVFIDFDTGNDGSVDYTPERRDAIQAQMESIYEGFNVTIVQTEPDGDHSTIFFNEGFPGGVAQDIDFRNLNKNDNALVNVTGLPGVVGDLVVPASAVIGAHELGHLLGLKHEDSFGPIGSGIQPGFGGGFSPFYPGPNGANESFDHIMTTPQFGSAIADLFTPSWLSERSSIKVALADSPNATDETMLDNDSIARAQPIEFSNFTVPNKIQVGQNADIGDFSVDIAVVVGNLTGNVDTIDFYEFSGSKGDLINMEVLSDSPDRFNGNSILSQVSVLDANGQFVNYYGTNAFNTEGLTGEDSVIVDLVLPFDGVFYVSVNAISANDSGAYELFVNKFNGKAVGLLGDINCDGVVDLLDVAPFVDLIVANEFSSKADINMDGVVDLLDVGPFVSILNSK